MNIDRNWNLTEEDLKVNRYYISECDKLGIEVSIFSENNDFTYTKDELKAMKILSSGRRLPKNLEVALLATREERISKRPSIGRTQDIDTEEVQRQFDEMYGEPHGIHFPRL